MRVSRLLLASRITSILDFHFAFSLAEHNHLIHGLFREDFLRSVRPEDIDFINMADRSQAEVGARVVAAQIAVTGVDESNPAAAARPDRDLGTVSVTMQSRIDCPNHEP